MCVLRRQNSITWSLSKCSKPCSSRVLQKGNFCSSFRKKRCTQPVGTLAPPFLRTRSRLSSLAYAKIRSASRSGFFKSSNSWTEKKKLARSFSDINAEQKKTKENSQDAKSSSPKAGSSLLFLSNAAEIARQQSQLLKSYSTGRLGEIKSANLSCFSFCLLACMRFTVGRFSRLNEFLCNLVRPQRDLAYYPSLAGPDLETGVVTMSPC